MRPNAEALLGVDIGTSSIKIAALGLDGALLGRADTPLPTTRLEGNRIEHDADAVWEATARTIRRVIADLRAPVVGVAVASMGEVGAPVDASGAPLGPMIGWSDPRAGEQEAWWIQHAGPSRIYDITGQALDRFFAASRLLWLREHQPDVLAAAAHWLSMADVVVHRLSGAIATDFSLASRTMLFDQRRREWSDTLLDLARLPRSLMPAVHASGTAVGEVTAAAARLTGLVTGTTVSVGGHDRLCGAFAARAGGDAAVDSIGTAETIVLGALAFRGGDPAESGHIPCYCDVVPGRYAFSARVGWAGGLLEWAAAALFGVSPSKGAELISALPIPIEFSGVVCQPTLGRPATPFWNPAAARGAFVGMTTAHDRSHMLQAILEAGCFSARTNIDVLERLTGSPLPALRIEGGPTRNAAWMQLRADAVGRELQVVDVADATAVGAALLAGVGAGAFSSHVEAARRAPLATRTFSPDAGRAAAYERAYNEVWLHLSAQLDEINHTLAGF